MLKSVKKTTNSINNYLNLASFFIHFGFKFDSFWLTFLRKIVDFGSLSRPRGVQGSVSRNSWFSKALWATFGLPFGKLFRSKCDQKNDKNFNQFFDCFFIDFEVQNVSQNPPKTIPELVQKSIRKSNHFFVDFSLIFERFFVNFGMRFSISSRRRQKCRDPRSTRKFSSGSRVAALRFLSKRF